MKPPQFFITLILSAICLLLSFMTLWQGSSVNSASLDFEKKRTDRQGQIAEKQRQIQAGQTLWNILTLMTRDIVSISDDKKDQKLHELLAKDVEGQGFKIQLPATSPSPSPSPATTGTNH